MRLLTLALLALTQVPEARAATPAPTPLPDAHAQCLKDCAGAPDHADGKKLLACLNACSAPDAGTPSIPDRNQSTHD